MFVLVWPRGEKNRELVVVCLLFGEGGGTPPTQPKEEKYDIHYL